ncbi:MAG: sensor histidine kinase [Butyricimonas faecihominis]
MKYGETPQITVICYQREDLRYRNKDNGPGIPKATKYIFNKYYQVNKDSTSKKGYGLGLTYVYNVIKAHKGKITVDSPPGKGCTFTIYLRKWKKK